MPYICYKIISNMEKTKMAILNLQKDLGIKNESMAKAMGVTKDIFNKKKSNKNKYYQFEINDLQNLKKFILKKIENI